MSLLSVLHELRLIHTDLKPENILLVKNDFRTVHVAVPGKVKLAPPGSC
jgi:dual-specificity kinase